MFSSGPIERSCQQYLAVRRELVPPDTFRLRYRQALSETVKSNCAVNCSLQPEKRLGTHIPPSIAEEDHDKLVNLVFDRVGASLEGNAIRFGIRPLEFAAWRDKTKQ